jgi:hydrogenase nickel incorporation protein HypA/HybF
VHELSLCRAIAGTVRDHAADRRVSRVVVQVGHLRQVVPDTLRYCWGLAMDGTDLAECELDIEHVPAVISCPACATEARIERPVLVCAACGSRSVQLISGDEFLVASIDVLERT